MTNERVEEIRRPSDRAFQLIAACNAAHFGDGLCAECVDTTLDQAEQACKQKCDAGDVAWQKIVDQAREERDGYLALYMEYVERKQGLECQLAQAERTIKELEHLKNDAILRFDEIDRENESLHKQITQAEREREDIAKRLTATEALCNGYFDEVHTWAEKYREARAEVERANVAIKTLHDQRDSEIWKAHVPVTGTQHDPARGLLHGYCERCRTPWPCAWSPESRDATRAEVERLRGYEQWHNEGLAAANAAGLIDSPAEAIRTLSDERDKAEVALARVRVIEERAKQMLYVAGCRDDGINEEMRILWRVLGIDGAALEGRG